MRLAQRRYSRRKPVHARVEHALPAPRALATTDLRVRGEARAMAINFTMNCTYRRMRARMR